jgi:HK97 family phage portal protein
MPRFFGSPTAKAAALIADRQSLVGAFRSNDQKMLLGVDDNEGDGSFGGIMSLGPGVATNKFAGFSSYIKASTKQVWASARAIDLVANVVLSTDMSFVSSDPDKRKRGAKVKVDPELARLLKNPNPYDTISELLYLWVAHMKSTGNCFWFKDEMNGYGQPKNIFALYPHLIRIIPDRTMRVAKYCYRVSGGEVEFTPDEIIHFKRPNAGSQIWGLGEIEQAESVFDDFINRALYNERFMQNGAMPSAVLVREEFKGVQSDWEKQQAAFNDKYAGVKNSGKVAWMNGKWSLLQMGITAQQMQEMEKAKVNVEQIFLNHGVPLSVAGFGSSNYATARVEDIQFRKYTCLPLLNLFTDAINSPHGLIPSFGPDLKLDFSLSGLIDVEQVMKDHGPLFDRGGCSPNELRKFCGLPTINDPYMDQYFISNIHVPIEVAGIAPDDARAGSNASANPPTGAPPQDQNNPNGPAAGKPKPGKDNAVVA